METHRGTQSRRESNTARPRPPRRGRAIRTLGAAFFAFYLLGGLQQVSAITIEPDFTTADPAGAMKLSTAGIDPCDPKKRMSTEFFVATGFSAIVNDSKCHITDFVLQIVAPAGTTWDDADGSTEFGNQTDRLFSTLRGQGTQTLTLEGKPGLAPGKAFNPQFLVDPQGSTVTLKGTVSVPEGMSLWATVVGLGACFWFWRRTNSAKSSRRPFRRSHSN